VDYVVRTGRSLWAIEVMSNRPGRLPGLTAFVEAHLGARPLVIGPGGLSFEEFFSRDPSEILE
jgi:hypothetical protein